MRWRGWFVTVVVVGLGGCAPPFPRPLTAADVAQLDSGAALIIYLAQRDASPAICDTRSAGAHVSRFDWNRSEALVHGLVHGQIAPELWRRCLDAALAGGSREDGQELLGAIARGTRDIATDGDVEKSPPLQLYLATLQAAYVDRPSGRDGEARIMTPIFDELRERFLAGRFGPAAARAVGELLAVVDLEQGRYGGRPVDVATIDGIAARGDEALLRRFADRLPAPALRDEARRRLIRLAIAASPLDEVRADAAAVEARLMREGVNRVSLAEHPAARASLDAAKLPARSVLVRQDLHRQQATLLSYVAGAEPSVLPPLSLTGALWVDVAGLSHPVTVCQAPRLADPTPCIVADDVRIENSLVAAAHDGTFHFRDRASEAEVVALTGTLGVFPLSMDIGGQRLVTYSWPIRFERPTNLILEGARDRGPNLTAAVTRIGPSRFKLAVTSAGDVYRAIVEETDLAGFHVVSRGARGRDGLSGNDGSDGMSGMDGTSASCPSFSGGSGSSGSRGSDGSNGGDGGDGGNGGDIRVEVDCGGGGCSIDDFTALRAVFLSEGGLGGFGGRGGRGGKGGRGGSGGRGTSCSDGHGGSSRSLSGGSDGMSGSDGSDGMSGRAGARGRPGQVHIEVLHAPRVSDRS
ncbi:MAG TPA: hypothetical protein VIF57_03040 [Polyangia bacterium]